MRISTKKNKVFRVDKETAKADITELNAFLKKTNGKVHSTYAANGYESQEYIVEF